VGRGVHGSEIPHTGLFTKLDRKSYRPQGHSGRDGAKKICDILHKKSFFHSVVSFSVCDMVARLSQLINGAEVVYVHRYFVVSFIKQSLSMHAVIKILHYTILSTAVPLNQCVATFLIHVCVFLQSPFERSS
jgi:hypothetical protein